MHRLTTSSTRRKERDMKEFKETLRWAISDKDAREGFIAFSALFAGGWLMMVLGTAIM